MPEYTLRCNECSGPFERFAWGELEEHKRICPHCDSQDVAVQWVVEQPYESLANFACG